MLPLGPVLGLAAIATAAGDEAPGSGGISLDELRIEQEERKKGAGPQALGFSNQELETLIGRLGAAPNATTSRYSIDDLIELLSNGTLKVQNVETPAAGAESDKDPASRN